MVCSISNNSIIVYSFSPLPSYYLYYLVVLYSTRCIKSSSGSGVTWWALVSPLPTTRFVPFAREDMSARSYFLPRRLLSNCYYCDVVVLPRNYDTGRGTTHTLTWSIYNLQQYIFRQRAECVRVCVLHIKPFFLPVDILHSTFFNPRRDTSYVVTKATPQRYCVATYAASTAGSGQCNAMSSY